MKTRRRLVIGVVLGVLLLALMAFPIGIAMHSANQEALNIDLIQALRTGQVGETRSLLAQGADPNAQDLPDPPARSLLQQLIEAVTHPTHPENQQARRALSCACDSKHAAALVKLLLEKGASVKADDASQQPALFWAARGGDMETVQILLDHGAEVNNSDMVGFTPLQGAALADSPSIVRLLLDHGAKVSGNTVDNTPASMIHSAEIKRMLTEPANKK